MWTWDALLGDRILQHPDRIEDRLSKGDVLLNRAPPDGRAMYTDNLGDMRHPSLDALDDTSQLAVLFHEIVGDRSDERNHQPALRMRRQIRNRVVSMRIDRFRKGGDAAQQFVAPQLFVGWSPLLSRHC